MFNYGLGHEERSLNVTVYVVIEERLINIGNWLAAHDASIQNEDVDLSKYSDGIGDKTFSSCDRRRVGLDRNRVPFALGFDLCNELIGGLSVVHV